MNDSGALGWVALVLLVSTLIGFSLWAAMGTAADVKLPRPHRRKQQAHDEVQAGDFVGRLELIVLNSVAILLHTLSGIGGALVARGGDPVVAIDAPLFEFVTNGGMGDFVTPRPKTIFTVSILGPSIAVEFITAAFHCVYMAALLDDRVDQLIRMVVDTPSANPLRWVEYGITATIMSTFGVVAIGVLDFYYFLRGLASGVCLQALGYLIELLGELPESKVRDRLYRIIFFGLGQLLNLPMIAILLYQTFGSKTHGALRLFLENALPLAFWFNTFGVVTQLSYNKWRQFGDPYFAERWYILLSLSTKLAVFWVSFGTFKKITEDNGFSAKAGVDWDAVRYSAMSLPFGIVFLFALSDARAWAVRTTKPYRPAFYAALDGEN
jgi:hypothetical protein